MLCSNCHSSNAPGAKFCAVCGADLHEINIAESRDENKTQAVDEALEYDDGFSVKQSDLNAERKDYEYYPDDNGYGNNSNWNSGYNNGGYNNAGYNGYNRGYNGGYNNNNGYNNGYGGGYNNSYNSYNGYNGYNDYSGYNNYGLNNYQSNTRSVGAIIIYMLSGVLALAIMLMTVLPSLDFMQAVDKAVDNMEVEGRYSGYSDVLKSRAKESIRKQFKEKGEETTKNVFQVVSQYYDTKTSKESGTKSETESDFQVSGTIILMMFITPMIFLLLWAIFSFCRNRAAGGMGLVGCISFVSVGVYWLLYLMNEVPIGKLYITGATEKVDSGVSLSQSGISLSMDIKDTITIVPYLMIGLGVAGIVMAALQLAKRDNAR